MSVIANNKDQNKSGNEGFFPSLHTGAFSEQSVKIPHQFTANGSNNKVKITETKFFCRYD